MPNLYKKISVASCVALVMTQSAFAQDSDTKTETGEEVQAAAPADPSQVIATVDGTDITLAHVIAFRTGLPQQYSQFPPELLLQAIVDQLVQHTLLMQAFEGEPTLGTQVTVENERRGLIAAEAVRAATQEPPSEEALRALYEEQYPEEQPETEYRASHILVESEDEAKALVEELTAGADFAALAKEKSTGPSGEAGGDLGWFGNGDMVPEFFDAVVALKTEEVSPPVQTQFGWHIIKLSETRDKERPSFDALRPQIVEQARQQQLEAYVEELRGKAEVTQADISAIDANVINQVELLDR